MAPVEKTDHQQRPENQKRAKDSYGAGLPPVYFYSFFEAHNRLFTEL
jgi:hypothetical protein